MVPYIFIVVSCCVSELVTVAILWKPSKTWKGASCHFSYPHFWKVSWRVANCSGASRRWLSRCKRVATSKSRRAVIKVSNCFCRTVLVIFEVGLMVTGANLCADFAQSNLNVSLHLSKPTVWTLKDTWYMLYYYILSSYHIFTLHCVFKTLFVLLALGVFAPCCWGFSQSNSDQKACV